MNTSVWVSNIWLQSWELPCHLCWWPRASRWTESRHWQQWRSRDTGPGRESTRTGLRPRMESRSRGKWRQSAWKTEENIVILTHQMITDRPGHHIGGWVHAGPRILPHSDGHSAHCQSHQQPRRGVALSQALYSRGQLNSPLIIAVIIRFSFFYSKILANSDFKDNIIHSIKARTIDSFHFKTAS